jgi:predicted CoA-binding protein
VDNFKNKNIAIVGVSEDPEKYGHKIFSDLKSSGYKIYGVNLKGGEVMGNKIYTHLKELPIKPDLVIIIVPPQVTEKIIDDCKELGVKQIWMQPGSESEEAIEKARRYGIGVISNACFMRSQGVW